MPADFFAMTPWQFSVYCKSYGKKMEAEYQQAAWLAWHIEAFARTKKLPKLKDVLGNNELKKSSKSGMIDYLKAYKLRYGVEHGSKISR
jgi:hypothetical protein